MESKKYQCCFYAVRHTEYDYVKERLLHHIEKDHMWAISKEISDTAHQDISGEHIHVMAQLTDKQYEALNKNMKDKYKLRGRAKSGLGRQYGKEEVKSNGAFFNYIKKDGNFETNITDDEIKKWKGGDAEKVKKVPTPWIRIVADEIIKKNPDKLWDMRLEVEFEIVRDTMLEHLGRKAKSFDELVFDRLFIGICNLLPKNKRFTQEFKKTISKKSYERFTGELY